MKDCEPLTFGWHLLEVAHQLPVGQFMGVLHFFPEYPMTTTKQLQVLELAADATISQAKYPLPSNILPAEWAERAEKDGAELVIVSTPAPETLDKKATKLIHKTLNWFRFNNQRYDLRPIPGEENLYVGEVDRGVIMLGIDRHGKVHDLKREAVLRGERVVSPYTTRMLAGRLFPGIELALVTVPTQLTEEEIFKVQNKMASLTWDGKKLRMVGGTGSAKKWSFLFCSRILGRQPGKAIPTLARGGNFVFRHSGVGVQ
jgi:hypothetical protein